MSPLALLNSKLGKLSLSSLSGYDRWLRPLILLVKFCCTFSILLISFLYIGIGLHTGFAYSMIGLTKPTNKGTSMSSVLPLICLRIIADTPLAFFIVLVICSLKSNKGSMYTPRSFSHVVTFSSQMSSPFFIVYLLT